MRLPWFFGPRLRLGRVRPPRQRGQHHSSSLLRVRQLERRRVLDAAAPSLVVGSTLETGQESTVTSSVTTADPLVFDWAAPDAGARQTDSPTTESAAAVQAFMAAAAGGAQSNGPQTLGGNRLAGDTAEDNQIAQGVAVDLIVTAAADQVVTEGTLLDLSAGPGKDALAFVGDEDVTVDHVAVVNWGDGTGFESVDIVDSQVVDIGGETLRFLTLGGLDGIRGTHVYADGDTTRTVRVRVANSNMGAFNDPSKFGINPDGTNVGTPGVDFVEDTFDVRVLSAEHDLIVTAASDQVVAEGTLLDLSAGPGKDALAFVGDEDAEALHVAKVNWGDGTGFESVDIVDSQVVVIDGEPVRFLTLGGLDGIRGTHVYADGDTTYTVRVRVANSNMGAYYDDSKFEINPDGTNVGTPGVDFVEDTFLVVVNNVVPTLGVTPLATTIDEGQALGIRALFSDPGFDNPLNTNPTVGPVIGDPLAESFRYYIEWGDGRDTVLSTPVPDTNGGPGASSTGMFGRSHTYADDGVYTVRVRIADDNMTGNFSAGSNGIDYVEYAFDVTVNNVIPTLGVTPLTMTLDEGQVLGIRALFSDPGFDNTFNTNPTMAPAIGDQFAESFRYYIEWGDGRDTVLSTPVPDTNGAPGASSTGMFGRSHTYADDGVYTVRVRLADDNMTGNFAAGAAGVDYVEYAFDVTVNNVVPTLGVTPSSTRIDEGTSVSFNATFSDDGFDNLLNTNPTMAPAIGDPLAESFRYYIEWGDGRDTVPSANVPDTNGGPGVQSTGTFNGSHVYADDGTYTVKVRIADDNMTGDFAGGVAGIDFIEQTFTVTVDNVNPDLTLTPSPTSINEGQAVSLSALFTDDGFDNLLNTNPTIGPALGDPLAESFRYYIEWGDGRDTVASTNVADTNGGPGVKSTGTFNGSHVYADDGVYTVTVRIADDNMTGNFTAGVIDVDFVEKTFTVTVSNVRPDLTLTPSPTSINEGQAVSFSALFADDGFDNPLNTNPTASPAIGDPLAESFRYYIEWGDGRNTVPSTGVLDVNGGPGVQSTGTFNDSHIYADDGTYTVTVRIADDNMTGNFANGLVNVDFVEKTFTVTVSNVRPSLSLTPSPTSINEGESVSFSALFADDGFDNPLNTDPTIGPAIGDPLAESFRYYIEWGDGRDTVPSTGVADLNGGPGVQSTGTFNDSHTFADDGVYTVRVRIADDNMTGNFTSGVANVDFVEKSITVTVSNVRPTLIATPTPTTINEGGSVSFAAIFADRGFDNSLNTNPTAGPAIGDPLAESFRYYIEWGDGRDTVPSTGVADLNGGPGVQSTGTFNGSHTFADDGVYTVRVRIADDNMTGNFTSGAMNVDFVEYSFNITVNNIDPTLRNTAGLEVNEGQAFVLTSDELVDTKNLGVFLEDPGFDNPLNPPPGQTQELFTGMSIDWGDGTATSPLTVNNSARLIGSPGVMTTAPLSHASHTYADDGVYDVSVTFKDDNGGFVTRSLQISVRNVVPTLSIGSVTPTPITINESSDVTFVANFSDVGFDNASNPNGPVLPLIADPKNESFRYFIDWGDGRDQVGTMDVADLNGAVGVLSTGTFNAMHNYADDGVYTVTVRIADDNMLAFVDSSKFALSADGGEGGVVGVDFIEQIFEVTVNNTDPRFIPNANGESFEGDDISSEGLTTIRVSYEDTGYDNAANLNAPVLPNISNPRFEIFTHVLDWGDGTVDAIHTYAIPGSYTVSVTIAGADLNGTFSFDDIPGSTSSVLTLVSGQTLNVGGETPYTYVINWGDGTIQTVTLELNLPLAPLASNGLSTVMTALRATGDANIDTSGSFEVQHRYLGPPNPLNPTADIGITVTVVDDNNATVSDIIFVPNPGIDVVNQRIDTTPQIPRLDFPTQPVVPALLNRPTGTIQSLQTTDVGAGGGETAAASKRYLELVAYAPDGTVIDRYELPEEELADLRKLFAKLPDGRYQIFLVRTDTNTRRLVMDVYVRRGRLIDKQDDTEGTRDRPPTSESDDNAAATMQQQPAAQPAANDAARGDAAAPPADIPATNMPATEVRLQPEVLPAPSPQPPAPSYSSLRWGSSLAGLAIATGASPWSRKVTAALAQADHRAWQRLRRAGRSRRANARNIRPDDRLVESKNRVQ